MMDSAKEISEDMATNDAQALRQPLLKALEGFAAVQQEQFQKLAAGKLKDIMSWRQRRQQIFDRLKKYLDEVMTSNRIRDDQDFLGLVQQRMQAILEAECALNEAANQQKARLTGELGTIRKGKKAIQRYRIHGPVTRPKFLSNRT